MSKKVTSAPQNRTNVRSRIPWVARAVAGVGDFAPGLSAALAERLFFTPPRPRRRDGTAEQGRGISVVVDGRRVHAAAFGAGPVILALHGWGGFGGQLESFVAPLVRRGYTVVTIDAPGHGRSGRGMSSAPQFARALRAVFEHDAVRANGLAGVIAHSLGAAAVALAMRDGLAPRRVVFIGPAADPPRWAETFAKMLGLRPKVVDLLRDRSERRLGLSWGELHVPTLARGFETPLLVVHDEADREVPIGEGEAIASAWPGATLVRTAGLGHNRILRDPAVVETAVAFLGGNVEPRACACGAPLASGAMCETCRLERELFVPALRLETRAA
jgi:pimeloyl-ACP methyl ester carboxylesterase